ncbi:MAG: hypothetical protein KC425_13425 [Anaerolineales bacterium]|nr:hypothetical protein [Anaerolineales bacterium]
MDSLFGIGLPELIVILILAGIVMGPERIRHVARWLGVMTVKLQTISRTFMRQLNSELDSMEGGEELRGAMQDVQELRRQVEDLRRELISTGRPVVDETRRAVRDSELAVSQSIAPPGLGKQGATAASGEARVSRQSAANGDEPSAQSVAETAVPPTPAELPRLLDVPDDPE